MLAGRYLSSSKLEDIALMRARGDGVREIAASLNRSPSTISRELRRNTSTRTYRLHYNASTPQRGSRSGSSGCFVPGRLADGGSQVRLRRCSRIKVGWQQSRCCAAAPRRRLARSLQ